MANMVGGWVDWADAVRGAAGARAGDVSAAQGRERNHEEEIQRAAEGNCRAGMYTHNAI